MYIVVKLLFILSCGLCLSFRQYHTPRYHRTTEASSGSRYHGHSDFLKSSSIVNKFASPTPSVTTLGSTSVAIDAFRAVASVPVMYSLMSFNEYITHRYYQHNEITKLPLLRMLKLGGGGHIEHHAETYDDMSLKTDERWKRSPAAQKLNSDKYRGTAFTWEVTGLMFLQLLVTCIPTLKLVLNINPLVAIAMIFPSLALHTLIWNALHPWMHGLPEIPMQEGPPAKLLRHFRSSKFFQFLYSNHQGHHVMSGLRKYNVCCPGFDHLLGTYTKECDWKAKVRPNFQIQQDAIVGAI